jgi:hypothetical protein
MTHNEVHYEVLLVLPLCISSYDTPHHQAVTRAFGALKKAYDALERYYNVEIESLVHLPLIGLTPVIPILANTLHRVPEALSSLRMKKSQWKA